MNISTYTVWRMRMKLLHMLEKMLEDTAVSGEIELDEKYLLNSHKGEKIDNLKPALQNWMRCQEIDFQIT